MPWFADAHVTNMDKQKKIEVATELCRKHSVIRWERDTFTDDELVVCSYLFFCRHNLAPTPRRLAGWMAKDALLTDIETADDASTVLGRMIVQRLFRIDDAGLVKVVKDHPVYCRVKQAKFKRLIEKVEGVAS